MQAAVERMKWEYLQRLEPAVVGTPKGHSRWRERSAGDPRG